MIASTHYLLIDGLNGGSRSDAYRGAFEIASYAFDIEAVAASGGGGGAAGRTEFGPLVVDLRIGSGLAALAETAAEGRAISAVRLVGVTRNGDEVYDLKLGEVRIAWLSDAGAGKDRLAFSYGEIELTTTPVRADGGLGRPETFRWDVARNAPGDGVRDPEPIDNASLNAAASLDEHPFDFVLASGDGFINARNASLHDELAVPRSGDNYSHSGGDMSLTYNNLDMILPSNLVSEIECLSALNREMPASLQPDNLL